MNPFEPDVHVCCPDEKCACEGRILLSPSFRGPRNSKRVKDVRDGGVYACVKCGLRYVVTSRYTGRAPVYQIGPPPVAAPAGTPPPKEKGNRPAFPTVDSDFNAKEPRA